MLARVHKHSNNYDLKLVHCPHIFGIHQNSLFDGISGLYSCVTHDDGFFLSMTIADADRSTVS